MVDKKKFQFSIFSPSDEMTIPDSEEKKSQGKRYVNFGSANDFPNYLWSLYLRSSVLNSIINGTVDYVTGEGTELSPELSRFQDEINADGETFDDIIRKITVDYNIFDGFALQIIYNFDGKINEIYWLDMRKIRLNEDETIAFYSDKMFKYNAAVEEYELFDANKKQKTAIFYYKGHLTRGIYPVCRYNGALNAIETSAQIGRFHLGNINNGLSNGYIVNFNGGVPTEEEKREIEKKLQEKFSGSARAGRTMVTFNDNKDSAVTIEAAPDNNFDEKYQSLYKSTMQEIFISLRATPELFGMSTEGNGFSKEEYLQAFELYNKTVVGPMQRDIVRCFDKIFGVRDSFRFIPFKIYQVDADKEINQTQNESISN